MGKDIYLRKKLAHRYLGSILDDDDDDDDHYCSFFDQQESQLHDDFVDDEPAPKTDLQEERRIYWESQQFLLQEILEQCESVGSKFREQMRGEIEIARESNFCSCWDKIIVIGCCIKCLRRAAVNQLCTKGFSALLCISKWKRTRKTPPGAHEYIEVIVSTQGRRKRIPLLVELGFRDEFRMGKACPEYNKLINQLPEIYIGKLEHLNAIIRLLCDAAKKSAYGSMEKEKLHADEMVITNNSQTCLLMLSKEELFNFFQPDWIF